MTCASCGRDLLVPVDELDGYAIRCRVCAGRPARGILVALLVAIVIDIVLWRAVAHLIG